MLDAGGREGGGKAAGRQAAQDRDAIRANQFPLPFPLDCAAGHSTRHQTENPIGRGHMLVHGGVRRRVAACRAQNGTTRRDRMIPGAVSPADVAAAKSKSMGRSVDAVTGTGVAGCREVVWDVSCLQSISVMTAINPVRIVANADASREASTVQPPRSSTAHKALRVSWILWPA